MDDLPEYGGKFAKYETVRGAENAWIVWVDADEETDTCTDYEINDKKESDELHEIYQL
jgi:hypothetical protein